MVWGGLPVLFLCMLVDWCCLFVGCLFACSFRCLLEMGQCWCCCLWFYLLVVIICFCCGLLAVFVLGCWLLIIVGCLVVWGVFSGFLIVFVYCINSVVCMILCIYTFAVWWLLVFLYVVVGVYVFVWLFVCFFEVVSYLVIRVGVWFGGFLLFLLIVFVY